jgi:crossover junction endodeoxyribonuclease RuvC
MSRTSTPTAIFPKRSWRRRNREISAPADIAARPNRIIAIDPGINATGYGVMEQTPRRIEVLAAGTITGPSRRSAPEKLAGIYGILIDLLEKYSPGALVLEDVFYHKNVRSTLRLGEVRGVCGLAAARRGLKVYTYASRRVKKAVVGNGSADKNQVRSMVKVLLGLEEEPGSLDLSDALALGITYFQDYNLFPAETN